MSELKPCPFCGSEKVVFKHYSYLGVNCFSLHYYCPSCNAGFRYCVRRHTTQAMYGVGDVILDNLDVLHTEFIKQFIREIEREQYVTELDQGRNKRYKIDFFVRLKTHIKDYQHYLKDEKGAKQQELYKLLCQVMELIPQVDMSYKWPAEWECRVDDTTYLTPMLNRLKEELDKRKGDKNV